MYLPVSVVLLVFISFYLQITSPSVGPLLISFLKPSNPHLHLFNFNASTLPCCSLSLSFLLFFWAAGFRCVFFLSSLFPLFFFFASLSFFSSFIFYSQQEMQLISLLSLLFYPTVPLILFFYLSLCLHLFSLLVFLLVSASMGSKEPTWGRTIAASVSLLLIPPLFRTLSPTGFRFLSPSFHLHPPCLYLSHLFLPLHFPSIFVPRLSWEQVVENDALL